MHDTIHSPEGRLSISNKLKRMARQFDEIGRNGLGLDQDDIERIAREAKEMAREVRLIERGGERPVNPIAGRSSENLHFAVQTIAGAMAAIESRNREPVVDPDGAIVEAIVAAQGHLAQAQKLLGRRVAS